MKSKTLGLAISCGTMMSLAGAASADFIVQFASVLTPTSFSTFGTVDTDPFPLLGDGTRQAVSFTIPNANDGYWRIYSDNPAVDSLGTVSFTGASGRSIRLVIGRPGIVFNPFLDAGAGACVDWFGGVSENGARVSVQASVSRNLANLSTSRVSRLKVGGLIVGTVSHNETVAPASGVPRDVVEIRAGRWH